MGVDHGQSPISLAVNGMSTIFVYGPLGIMEEYVGNNAPPMAIDALASGLPTSSWTIQYCCPAVRLTSKLAKTQDGATVSGNWFPPSSCPGFPCASAAIPAQPPIANTPTCFTFMSHIGVNGQTSSPCGWMSPPSDGSCATFGPSLQHDGELEHTPILHSLYHAQCTLHAPQLLASFAVSTHPDWQHSAPVAHLLEHDRQLSWSSGSTHLFPHAFMPTSQMSGAQKPLVHTPEQQSANATHGCPSSLHAPHFPS